jgi:hypothetical protein
MLSVRKRVRRNIDDQDTKIEGYSDFSTSCPGSTSDLAKDAAELQKVCAQYESTVNDFKSKLENATSFKTNDGIVLDNLTAAAVAAAGIHKNGKNAFGDWAFYEIKVDGKVLKFGIADASRVRKTGEYAKLPERLAQ